jgi:tocopherol O-methyltransferase
MKDKRKFCAEIHRVLGPGGRFAITAWLSRENPGKLESLCLLRPICDEGRLPGLSSESEYRSFLRDAGFQNIFFEDLTRRVSRTWSACLRRFTAGIITDRTLLRRLLDRSFTNRIFALTVCRLWIAYHTGSMRYGIFWGGK